MYVPSPAEIQLASAVAIQLIQNGKLVAAEVKSFIASVFGGAHPELTPAECDAIALDVMGRAALREALSRAEAGQTGDGTGQP